MANLQVPTWPEIDGKNFRTGMFVTNPESTVIIGWKSLLVQDILDWTVNLCFADFSLTKEYPRLSKIDIEILLRAVFFVEKNPNADKILSDRVIGRFLDDTFGWGRWDDWLLNKLIYTHEYDENDNYHTIVNMENYDLTWNPKEEIIEAIYTYLNPKKRRNEK